MVCWDGLWCWPWELTHVARSPLHCLPSFHHVCVYTKDVLCNLDVPAGDWAIFDLVLFQHLDELAVAWKSNQFLQFPCRLGLLTIQVQLVLFLSIDRGDQQRFLTLAGVAHTQRLCETLSNRLAVPLLRHTKKD